MRPYLPFLLGLFLLAAILRADFYFTLLYFLVALYLLGHLWARRTLRRLRVERTQAARAFLGEKVTVELTLENRGRLPIPWLEVNEVLPVELTTPPFYRHVISLGAREAQTLRYSLTCRRRGYYPIGPLGVRTGDLLGIQPEQGLTIPPGTLIVYPRVLPLQRLGLPTRSPLVALPARTPLFEDPSRIMGVRGYQRGDSPRRIHWSATARAGQLLVKQYQPAIAREVLICLDLNEEGYTHGQRYSATELAIVVAASLANHLIVRDGLPVGLATEAMDPLQARVTRFALPLRRERAHLMGILEILARVRVAPTTPLAERLRQESLHLSWGSTLAIITGSQSEGLLERLLQLRRAGFAVALLLVQPARLSPGLQAQARLMGISLYTIWDEEEVGRCFSSR